jgi:phage protein U
MNKMHTHTFQGQSLRHSHEGGDVLHGYFGHPEDRNDQAEAEQDGPARPEKYEITVLRTDSDGKTTLMDRCIVGADELDGNKDTAAAARHYAGLFTILPEQKRKEK